MYKILDLYEISTLDCPYFTYPLGFSAKHEAYGVDLRSYAADLQNDSEILKLIQQYLDHI